MAPERNMTAPKKANLSGDSVAINRPPQIRNRQPRVSTRGWTRFLPSPAPSWSSWTYLTRLAQWTSPAARRADFNRYRAHRVTLRVDQRYTPLVPSQLRMMTTTEELPDPEPPRPQRSDESAQSDARTIDKPLSDGGTVDTTPSDKGSSTSD
jgi:hypothetical protein